MTKQELKEKINNSVNETNKLILYASRDLNIHSEIDSKNLTNDNIEKRVIGLSINLYQDV